MKRLFLSLWAAWVFASVSASAMVPEGVRRFANHQEIARTLSVRCISQDPSGYVWLGTMRGLYSYDGYELRKPDPESEVSGWAVTRILALQDRVYMACLGDFVIYDIPQGRFIDTKLHFHNEIRGLAAHEGYIYIASDGLFRFSPGTGEIAWVEGLDSDSVRVYDMLSNDRMLLLATSSGLWAYHYAEDRFTRLSSDNRIACLATVYGGNSLLAGAHDGLTLLDLDSGSILWHTDEVQGVKCLYTDRQGKFLAGTENGLYAGELFGSITHHTHDSRDASSLANDVVWDIFPDNEENLWIATNDGVSLLEGSNPVTEYRLSEMTGIGTGNRISTILSDDRGDMWFGGDHGIIRSGGAGVRWYRTEDPASSIPHNRIRKLFLCRSGQLLVASDGGLLVYDSARESFSACTVENGTRWIYDIAESLDGTLWLATFEGLYHIPAVTPGVQTVRPFQVIHPGSGPADNSILSLCLDAGGNVWTLHTNGDISRYGSDGQPKEALDRELPPMDFLLSDWQGDIWMGSSRGVFCVRVGSGGISVREVFRGEGDAHEILAVCDAGNELLLSTTEGILILDKSGRAPVILGVPDIHLSLYIEKGTDRLWMGATDKIYSIRPRERSLPRGSHDLRITGIATNGTDGMQAPKPGRSGILTFDHHVNAVEFHVSDFDFTDRKLQSFAYRLDGYDRDWRILSPGDHILSYTNLSPRRYALRLRRSDSSEEPQPALQLRIREPWYFTPLMRLLYLLAFLAMFLGGLNYLLYRKRNAEERKKVNDKVKFMGDLAHELKTPLTLILTPVSQLLSQTHDPAHVRQLERIRSNAAKIEGLVREVIDLSHSEQVPESLLFPTLVEFVGFCRSIFSRFQEDERNADKEFVFDTTHEVLYLDVDVQRMESTLVNLLSNACKFTSAKDAVILSLAYNNGQGMLEIKVSDTGPGIPEAELPFVFQRYFQSSQTRDTDTAGTGIGLSVVKSNVDMLGGQIEVLNTSQGITFCILLPIQAATSRETESAAPPDGEQNSKLLVAIVEDNLAICELVQEVLGPAFRYVTAVNGHNGLMICTELVPDLIIADYRMPVMDGIEMCRRIRDNARLSGVPIIMLTGEADEHMEKESIRINIDAFVRKPFDAEMLRARVNQLIESRNIIRRQSRIERISTPEPGGEISQDEKFLMKVTRYIEDNLDDAELNVNSLAEQSRVSTKQLYRKVKSLTGKTPVDYIRSIRIKKAALLLQGGRFTVSEVMYMVGFSNSSYFARAFKAEFGLSPKDYMAQRHNSGEQ